MLNSEKLPDKTTDNRVRSIVFKKIKKEAELEEKFLLKNRTPSERTDFWKLWVRYQNYLYQRCLTWMKGNPTDAQEALSRASIKAWEKWQNHAGKIIHPRAWLTQLTHNLCMDMHRERTREASSIESLDTFAVTEDEYVHSSFSSPESAVLSRERVTYIHRAVDALPAKLRTPFILRYYQEMSYQDIAQQLALSNDNVRKRVQQARTILQKRLNKYFSGLDDSSPKAPPLNSPLMMEVTSRDNPPRVGPNSGVEAISPLLPQTQESRESIFPTRGRQFCHEIVTPVLEEPESERTTTSECETPITAGCTPKSIDYKITATCLEVLPHAWYNSLSSLGWR